MKNIHKDTAQKISRPNTNENEGKSSQAANKDRRISPEEQNQFNDGQNNSDEIDDLDLQIQNR